MSASSAWVPSDFGVRHARCPDRSSPRRHGGHPPVRLSIDALAQLQALGAAATLDRFPGLGHGIDPRVLARIVERLRDAA